MWHTQGRTIVNGGCDGGIQEILLVWGEAGVCDGPAQISCVYILAQAPVILRLIDPDPPVMLERRCKAATTSGQGIIRPHSMHLKRYNGVKAWRET